MDGAASICVPCGKAACALLSGFVMALTIVDAMAIISSIVVTVARVGNVVMGHGRSEVPMGGWKAIAVLIIDYFDYMVAIVMGEWLMDIQLYC